MKTLKHSYPKLGVAIMASLALAACSAVITTPDGAVNARNKLTRLQADPKLSSLAPIEIQNAELAVVAAEHPERDQSLSAHQVLIANRKVEIAELWAQSRLYENQREALSQASDAALLDARNREVTTARRETRIAQNQTAIARTETELARTDAENARNSADSARRDTAAALLATDELQRQITALNAIDTDRGLVVTLGDVLFATGKSTIVGGNDTNLAKLAVFLNRYSDRTVTIEGHTDSVGSESSNMGLSQRRADSVKDYLVMQGIASNRLLSYGKGENSPVSVNDTETGRQQNRRVEVIIANNTAVITP